jgi:hypothetical protein
MLTIGREIGTLVRPYYPKEFCGCCSSRWVGDGLLDLQKHRGITLALGKRTTRSKRTINTVNTRNGVLTIVITGEEHDC